MPVDLGGRLGLRGRRGAGVAAPGVAEGRGELRRRHHGHARVELPGRAVVDHDHVARGGPAGDPGRLARGLEAGVLDRAAVDVAQVQGRRADLAVAGGHAAEHVRDVVDDRGQAVERRDPGHVRARPVPLARAPLGDLLGRQEVDGVGAGDARQQAPDVELDVDDDRQGLEAPVRDRLHPAAGVAQVDLVVRRGRRQERRDLAGHAHHGQREVQRLAEAGVVRDARGAADDDRVAEHGHAGQRVPAARDAVLGPRLAGAQQTDLDVGAGRGQRQVGQRLQRQVQRAVEQRQRQVVDVDGAAARVDGRLGLVVVRVQSRLAPLG